MGCQKPWGGHPPYQRSLGAPCVGAVGATPGTSQAQIRGEPPSTSGTKALRSWTQDTDVTVPSGHKGSLTLAAGVSPVPPSMGPFSTGTTGGKTGFGRKFHRAGSCGSCQRSWVSWPGLKPSAAPPATRFPQPQPTHCSAGLKLLQVTWILQAGTLPGAPSALRLPGSGDARALGTGDGVPCSKPRSHRGPAARLGFYPYHPKWPLESARRDP